MKEFTQKPIGPQDYIAYWEETANQVSSRDCIAVLPPLPLNERTPQALEERQRISRSTLPIIT